MIHVVSLMQKNYIHDIDNTNHEILNIEFDCTTVCNKLPIDLISRVEFETRCAREAREAREASAFEESFRALVESESGTADMRMPHSTPPTQSHGKAASNMLPKELYCI